MSMMMMMMICRSMNSPNRRVASFWRMFYDSFLMFSDFNDGYLLFSLFSLHMSCVVHFGYCEFGYEYHWKSPK